MNNKQKQAEKLVAKATSNFTTMHEDISKSIHILNVAIQKDHDMNDRLEKEILEKKDQITATKHAIDAKKTQIAQYQELLNKIEEFVV